VKVLAIDTATLSASAAIVDGAQIVEETVRTTTHSDELMLMIARVCERAGIAPRALDAVAVGAGPGSFTGLRIGMATAKGIAFAAGRPLWVVSSLAALAFAAVRRGVAQPGDLVVPVLDARRNELYAGWYRAEADRVVAIAPEQVMPPGDLAPLVAAKAAARVVMLGDALTTYDLSGVPDVVRVDAPATPGAVEVALLALAGDRADVLAHGAPVYIRPSEAEVMYPQGVPGALRKR
jgi:tRNA threonylcarbamoyladenosine biosynthesis protein TsaB